MWKMFIGQPTYFRDWQGFLDWTWDRGWDERIHEVIEDPCQAMKKVQFVLPRPYNTTACHAEIRAWSDGYHACVEYLYGSRQWRGATNVER